MPVTLLNPQDPRTALEGAVLRPGDPGYDQARAVFNGMVDRRPALIVQCAGVPDVVAAVRYAVQADLPLAVRAGGHGVSGYAVCDGGVVIDLRPMKDITIDPDRRTVRAGAGLTWGELDAATQAYGLAVTGGRVSTTGVAGLVLGAGSGWLERRLGYTCDSLLGADVVLADGAVVRAGPADDPDRPGDPELLWGLTGGGGNFGVVTSFDLQLHPVGPEITGGMLVFGRDRAREVVRRYRDLMATASDDFGGGLGFLHAPPEPFIPPALHGAPVLSVIVAHFGTAAQAATDLAPLRALGPLLDLVQPMPYAGLQQLLDAGNPAGNRQYWRAEVFTTWSDELIDVVLAQITDVPSPLSLLFLEPLGGALSRVPEDATALGRRDATLAYHCLSQWVDPRDDQANLEWTRRCGAALAPFATTGVNLNFTSEQGPARVRATFGQDKYDRLVVLKDRYDPDNRFRLNQNITPSWTPYPPTGRTS